MTLYVNVYELDRHFGGPEEGGWWFDTGTPVPELSRRLPEGATKSMAYKRAALTRLTLPVPTYSRGSMRYSGGQYTVRVESQPAQPWPTERPFYE